MRRPLSVDAAARRSGEAARCHCSMKRLRWISYGVERRLHHGGERGVMVVAERDGDGELARAGDVDFAHDGDVAVERLAEVPGHAVVMRRGPDSRRWSRRSRSWCG